MENNAPTREELMEHGKTYFIRYEYPNLVNASIPRKDTKPRLDKREEELKSLRDRIDIEALRHEFTIDEDYIKERLSEIEYKIKNTLPEGYLGLIGQRSSR